MSFAFHNDSAPTYEPGALFLGTHNGREIGIKTERHAITFAGSGTGKGVALLVPNARRWPHNLLMIDTKGENALLSWREREALGQKVCILDPLDCAPWQSEARPDGIPRRLKASFNPLAAIDANDPRARVSLSAIGNGMIVVHDPKHMEWATGARQMLAGLAAWVVKEAPAEQRRFSTIRNVLLQPANLEDATLGLYADAQRMAATPSDTGLNKLIREAGISIMSALEKERGMEQDFLSNIRRSTSWLDDDGVTETLATSSFQLSELKTGNLSVYLVLPTDADIMATYSPFLRLFVKAGLNAMSDGGRGSGVGNRCLFMLDEFYSLGRLEDVVEAAGKMRSYGVSLWPFMQTLGQLHELYGQHGSEAFFDNADAQIFFGITGQHTLQYVSTALGVVRPSDLPDAPEAPILSGSGGGAALSALLSGPRGEYRAAGGFLGGMLDAAAASQSAALQARYQDEMNKHQKAMQRLGRSNLDPGQVAELIGKNYGDTVARSMIVFAPAGKVYNLLLAPYFIERPAISPAVTALTQDDYMKVLFLAVFGGMFAFVGFAFSLSLLNTPPPLGFMLAAPVGILAAWWIWKRALQFQKSKPSQ